MKQHNDFWPQLGRYAVTTGVVIVTDMGLYWLLSMWLNTESGLALAKGVSFCVAAALAFGLNKTWTFRPVAPYEQALVTSPRRANRQLGRFVVLNGASLLGNILRNQGMFTACVAGLGYNRAKLFCLVSAVTFSTVFNYLGQKYWVFR